VVVRVEAGAEPLWEGDGAESCVTGCTGARAAEGRAQRTDQNPEHGACHLRVVVQKGRRRFGRESTHCRTGRCGSTWPLECWLRVWAGKECRAVALRAVGDVPVWAILQRAPRTRAEPWRNRPVGHPLRRRPPPPPASEIQPCQHPCTLEARGRGKGIKVGRSFWPGKPSRRGYRECGGVASGVAEARRFAEGVYVLHVFKKESRSGVGTPRPDKEVIRVRLEAAEQHHRQFYGERRGRQEGERGHEQ